MTTNAYLLTPEVADKLLAWKITSYQITVDGPPETHDCSRPTPDGKGTFSQIFRNLSELHKRQDEFHVTLRVNFDKKSQPYLEKFLDLVERDLEQDPRFRLNFHKVFLTS